MSSIINYSNLTEFESLGRMAGTPAYLPGIGKELTYSRNYQPFRTHGNRQKISEIANIRIQDCKEFGEKYSFTPLHLRDGRPFGREPTTEQGGGFFLTVKTFDNEDQKRFFKLFCLCTRYIRR